MPLLRVSQADHIASGLKQQRFIPSQSRIAQVQNQGISVGSEGEFVARLSPGFCRLQIILVILQLRSAKTSACVFRWLSSLKPPSAFL